MRWLALLILLAMPATADEEVIAGLSQNRISITADFDGSEILIFGAVKREQEIPVGDLGVIVTVEGPDQVVTVRRKSKRALIWVNTAHVDIDRAPSFYAVNTSGPLDEVLSNTSDLRHKITTLRAIRSVGAPMDVSDSTVFTDALVRIRERDALYQTNIGAVNLTEQTLFHTSVTLPANLVEGVYETRIFLTRGGRVVAQYTTALRVEKVGLERFLYNLAHEQPLIYGLMSLAIAIAAGWGASAAFRYVKG